MEKRIGKRITAESQSRKENSASQRLSGKAFQGVILSAGFSKRMGEFKPLIIYNEKSFLENIAYKLSQVCNKIIIVTGYNSDLIEQHIKSWDNKLKSKVNLVFNPNYEKGMFTSLKRGVEANSGNWILYHFVDQPTLPQAFYNEFVKRIDSNFDWLQPVKVKRKGHPVLFNKIINEKILSAPDDSNLREITKKDIKKNFWQCDYKEIFDDIDKPEDMKKLDEP